MTSLLFRVGLGLAAVTVAGGASAQELAPREPAAKPSYQSMLPRASADRITVKFREGLRVRPDGAAGLKGLSPADADDFAQALEATGAGPAAIRRLHSTPPEQLDADRAEGEAEGGQALADLNLYYVIRLPAGANAAAVADKLNDLPFVEYAAPAPRPAPPPVDIAPTTPRFSSDQGYRKGGRTGVGALDGRDYPGGDGLGMRVVDTEYEWTLDHEDLEIPASRMLTGGETASAVYGPDHGTAVLGEIVGKRNAYGVTGIAPRAAAYVSPAVTEESDYSPARGVMVAGEVLRRGDVLVIEQQYWVCGYPTAQNRYGPLETLQDVFDAVSALTARGVIVVAAAGNGNVDLDAPECKGQFKRGRRNSGAIIVGAGSSSTHSRLSFSSYGSRVDVQGWGENVTTTGYGSLFGPNGDPRQFYTSTFNGTSSATPIVAGAILAIQGVRKACGLKPLSPAQMRQTLIETGTPQGPGAGKIGPLPRILPALRSTDARACVNAAGRASASLVVEDAVGD